jgi:hypothetical protein
MIAWLAVSFMAVAGTLPAVGQSASNSVAPDARATLDRMGAYLRTLQVFQIEAAIQQEEVLDNGLKLQFHGSTTLSARKPDRLRINVSKDWQERDYVYDGKQFTLWARRAGFYAAVPAPPTIGELAVMLEENLGVELPLVDLFRWGIDAAGTNITEVVDAGLSRIGGAECLQFAFRQEGLDWQIWIQSGDYPLPRKVVITTTTDEARPQFQATLTWNLAPTFTDEDFTFTPPADARRIVFDASTTDVGQEIQEK